MSHIYWISQIQLSERALVGNDFFILSQLLQHGCSIMPGFVLSHLYTADFLADLDLAELTAHAQSDRARKIQFIANRNQQIIQNKALLDSLSEVLAATQQLNSPSLILQPSITLPNSSLARNGSLWRSHTCNNHPQSIATALKKVWSELFTATSLLYCYEQGLKVADLKLAILVRPLTTAYASGTIEIDKNVLKVKANWGLEQSLLQGEVEPDRYCLDRTGYILSRHLGHKNYAYRPKDHPENFSAESNLEAYIPDIVRAQTYVLDRLAIAKLLQLTKVILEHQPEIKYLVWTAPAITDRSLPNFSFTQISCDLPAASIDDQTDHSQTALPSLLTGIAAAAGSVVAKTVVVPELRSDTAIPQGCILVTKEISPQQIHLLKQVGGIITETGGTTSHGAIVARELNIPAIANATNATKILQQGIEVVLDGDAGKVYPAATKHLATRRSSHQQFDYPIATQLMVNLSQPESIDQTCSLPVDGVGLLRSELMLAELLTPQLLSQPGEKIFRLRFLDLLTSSLRQFVAAFAPRPVFYRSIDWYAQDTLNPVLGNRGTYSYLNDPTLFYLELEALAIIAQSHCNLKIILPFVRSVEEFKFCYRAIENFGLTSTSSQVWIMAEVPSVMMLLPEYIRAGVQGIAIGTNDLTQLLLGVDREQAQFSDRGLNANHQAMQQAIYKLITVAKANNIGCCICGQAPVDYPELIPKLITWGIDAISVEPEAIPRTYQAIARAERKIILKHELDR